jgi:hypothetical protein
MLSKITEDNIIITNVSDFKKICKNICIDEQKLARLRKKLTKFGDDPKSKDRKNLISVIIETKTLIYFNKWRRDNAFKDNLVIQRKLPHVK